jgi:diguanylate cyclase (GGDEF)-like protein
MSNKDRYYKDKIKRLNRIGVMISKEKDIDKLLNLILDESLTLTDSDAGSIYFREEIDGEDLLVFKCSINRSTDFNYTGKSIKVDDNSVSGYVTLNGEEVVLNNKDESRVHIDKFFDREVDYETVNMIVVPMKNEVNKVVGVFQILNKNLNHEKIVPYNDEDIDIVKSLASQCAIYIDRIRLNQLLERNVNLTRTTLIKFYNSMKQAMDVIGDDILKEQKEFKELATTDELTGLLTRNEGLSFLEKQVEFASLNGIKLVIAFVDINNLKFVNDTYGHGEGDKLIKHVVDIIQGVARTGDFIFRYGGDEFILCIYNADLNAASKMKIRIDNAFNSFNKSFSRDYDVSASFGFAEYNYSENISIEELIKTADQRMYVAKEEHKKNRK